MDRHDREKEMSSELLSAFNADVKEPERISKAFTKLLQSEKGILIESN
jgi:hypothetical protein